LSADLYPETGIPFLRGLAEKGNGTALVSLSRRLKRRKAWDSAADLWIKRGADDLFALTELAKYFEHRSGDLDSALRATQDILRTCSSDECRGEAEKRLARLTRKIAAREANRKGG
jgi:hypothetical protein